MRRVSGFVLANPELTKVPGFQGLYLQTLRRRCCTCNPELERRLVRMRYVVTGGACFIGSTTVEELVRRGESVVVLDDLSAGKEENLAEIRGKISFIKGSINDLEAVRRAMQESEEH